MENYIAYFDRSFDIRIKNHIHAAVAAEEAHMSSGEAHMSFGEAHMCSGGARRQEQVWAARMTAWAGCRTEMAEARKIWPRPRRTPQHCSRCSDLPCR